MLPSYMYSTYLYRYYYLYVHSCPCWCVVALCAFLKVATRCFKIVWDALKSEEKKLIEDYWCSENNDNLCQLSAICFYFLFLSSVLLIKELDEEWWIIYVTAFFWSQNSKIDALIFLSPNSKESIFIALLAIPYFALYNLSFFWSICCSIFKN